MVRQRRLWEGCGVCICPRWQKGQLEPQAASGATELGNFYRWSLHIRGAENLMPS